MLDQFKERMDEDQEKSIWLNQQRKLDQEKFELYRSDADVD